MKWTCEACGNRLKLSAQGTAHPGRCCDEVSARREFWAKWTRSGADLSIMGGDDD